MWKMRIESDRRGSIFMTREVKPYNYLTSFYKIESLLETVL
jgi:hypothetical protein